MKMMFVYSGALLVHEQCCCCQGVESPLPGRCIGWKAAAWSGAKALGLNADALPRSRTFQACHIKLYLHIRPASANLSCHQMEAIV